MIESFMEALISPYGFNALFSGITSIVTVTSFLYNLRSAGKHQALIKSLNEMSVFNKGIKETETTRDLVIKLLDAGELLYPAVKEKLFLMLVFRLLVILGLYSLINIDIEGSSLVAWDSGFEGVDLFFVLGQLVVATTSYNPILNYDEKAFLLNMKALKLYYYDEIVSHYLNDINVQVGKLAGIRGKRKKLVEQAKVLSEKFDKEIGKKKAQRSFTEYLKDYKNVH